jgi:hypothetical protein
MVLDVGTWVFLFCFDFEGCITASTAPSLVLKAYICNCKKTKVSIHEKNGTGFNEHPIN